MYANIDPNAFYMCVFRDCLTAYEQRWFHSPHLVSSHATVLRQQDTDVTLENQRWAREICLIFKRQVTSHIHRGDAI